MIRSIQDLLTSGLDLDQHTTEYRRVYFINSIGILIVCLCVIFAFYDIITDDDWFVASLNLMTAVLTFSVLIVLRITRKINIAANLQLLVFGISEAYLVGTSLWSNYDLVWIFVLIPFIFMLKGATKGLIISVLYLSAFLSYVIPQVNTDISLNLIFCSAAFCFSSYYYERSREITHSKLQEAFSEAKEHAIIDDLTHIYNRRYFNEIFDQEIRNSRRSNDLLAFFILDVDYFKQFNDNYGHHNGDKALEQIGTLLKKHLRRGGDYPFRLGGEEFGGLIHGDNHDDIFSFVDMLRKKVEELNIEHKYSRCSKVLTASIGAKIVPCDVEISDDDLYRMSDELLYQAKECGRNKTITS